MIVVDVEATGVDAQKDSLVSIGAVDFNHPEITFYEECRIWDGAHIDPEALKVIGLTEEQVSDPKKQTEAELISHFLVWLKGREERTLAGQNPQFDLTFIRAAAYRGHINIDVAHRTYDLHSITYFHMIRRGLTSPTDHNHSGLNSDNYVGIPAEPKPHIALNGALWETEAFCRLLYDKSCLPQFSQYQIPWLKKA